MTSGNASITRVYLDSPVFITAISGSTTVPEKERDELRALLQQVDEGAVTAVISTFIMAEVRKFRKDGQTVDFDPEEAARVRTMFEQGRLEVLPVTERIALRAAEIGNDFERLMPGDCVHIATAEFASVDALFTRDGLTVGRRKPDAMLYYDGHIGGLRIVPPFNPTGPLFDHLRMIPVRPLPQPVVEEEKTEDESATNATNETAEPAAAIEPPKNPPAPVPEPAEAEVAPPVAATGETS